MSLESARVVRLEGRRRSETRRASDRPPARRLGDPYTLARTLLMAGWVPFWRNELSEAEAMFREALEVARSEDRRDAWAESRALVGLANVTSATADERDALLTALEAAGVHRRGRA